MEVGREGTQRAREYERRFGPAAGDTRAGVLTDRNTGANPDGENRVGGAARVGLSVEDRRVDGRLGVEAVGQTSLASPVGDVRVRGEALVGADGAATGQVNRRGVDVGASAFVGGRLQGEVGREGRFGGVSLRGELSAGVGGAAGVRANVNNGRISFGANLGATLGLGARLGFNVSIDYRAVGQAIGLPL
ncbi:MAG: hypothetical protein INH41_05015 [Myxococcaceae bacterium]|nr:hypothetical protein [Myxococcaceae bacterium]